jgi:hypothetical protein
MNKELKKVINNIKARIDLNSMMIEVNEDSTLSTELKGENIALEYVLKLIHNEIEKKI